MDLLIHAVIWLLKQLFGDNEKPAEMDRPSRPHTQSRPRSSGNAPSLEELLAEVRREAERKQQGGGGSQQMPPQQKPQRRAPVPQQELEPQRPRHVTVESAPETMPAPPLHLPKLAPVMTVDDAREEASRPMEAMPSTKPQPKKQGKQKQRRAQAEVQKAEGLIASGVDSKVAIQALLQTVRNGSDADRKLLTQQAFILKEIFGPCRCQSPYKAPMQSRLI